jgi:hypothetical protein
MLAAQKDRETIVAGVKAMRRIFQAPAMARHIAYNAPRSRPMAFGSAPT